MRPMLATPGPLPEGPEWTFETKWDGIRILFSLSGDSGLRLTSRNGKDLTSGFPEMAELAAALREQGIGDALLDGELIAALPGRVPSLGAIATRIHRRGVTPAQVQARPVHFVVFDVIRLEGRDLTALPLSERRLELSRTLPPGARWTLAEVFQDGAALLAATKAEGFEGVVAKRATSPYRPGVRSRDWIKVVHRVTSDVAVIGWRPESGGRMGRIGSLSVAEPAQSGWSSVGRAGSGMTQTLSDALLPVLVDIERVTPVCEPLEPADADSRWCDPVLVVEVAHLGRTEDGALRHPVIVRMRPDLTADDLAPR